MHLHGAKGESVSTAFSGRPLEIHLPFENQSGQPFPQLVVSVNVRTHFDAPVFVQTNQLTGDSFGPLPTQGTFVCRIPSLPLPATSYRLGFSVFADTRGSKVIDSMTHAMDLPVESGDFFGSGILPPVQQGVCLVGAEWELRAEQLPTESASAVLHA